MRNARDEFARFNWITPATFGARIGGEKPVSPDRVRKLIRAGKIRSEFLHVTNPGSGRPDYRIDPAAVEAFHEDHKPQILNAA